MLLSGIESIISDCCVVFKYMKPNNEHLVYCSSFSGNSVLWEIDNQNKTLCYSLWGVLLFQKQR